MGARVHILVLDRHLGFSNFGLDWGEEIFAEGVGVTIEPIYLANLVISTKLKM